MNNFFYNVTIQLDPSIEAQWLRWMREEHLQDVMSTGCFTAYRMCKLRPNTEEDGLIYSIQYFCKDASDYQQYLDNHATEMREKGIKLFGNQFIAFRSLMDLIAEG